MPYVPFKNREDHKLAQPASHIVVGRRGVGKSTLLIRAMELLENSHSTCAALDMQAYTELSGDALVREVLHDLAGSIKKAAANAARIQGVNLSTDGLDSFVSQILDTEFDLARAPAVLRRAVATITQETGESLFVFLDDFHVVDFAEQANLLHIINGSLKGANGWLKVAGLRSLLNHYDPAGRRGLQVPGDAQEVSLDLTLENPSAAEEHLRDIIQSFLGAVGYSDLSQAMPVAAFKRLVWANAGVPRDALQMFARAIEHARRNQHVAVTVSDVNVAIGEFGQRKLDDVLDDARNEQGVLRSLIEYLIHFCLDERQTNAFLVRAEQGSDLRLIQVLSDLRLVHLIHQSITPDRAGERYEAFILDYCLFTGFRRRRNIAEMRPQEREQFNASELRKLPKLPGGFSDELHAHA